MSNTTSSIEWTDATWNPLVGCSRVSQGCVHCYAETMAARIANAAQAALRAGKELTDIQKAYREVVMWERGGKFAADEHDKALPKWNNEIRLVPSVLTDPLRWKQPRRVFVNSMTDLFHEKVPFDYVDKVFAIMALTPQHTYQVLTKRPERMAEYFDAGSFDLWNRWRYEMDPNRRPMPPAAQAYGTKEWTRIMFRGEHDPARFPFPLSNVWLGTSVEDQKAADTRIPHLLRCPAAVRFLSCEPLLGPVDLRFPTETWDSPNYFRKGKGCSHCCTHQRCDEDECTRWYRPNCPYCHGTGEGRPIDWVIAGGESGPGARPMHPDWARSLRDQCEAAGVPYFFKQFGAWAPTGLHSKPAQSPEHCPTWVYAHPLAAHAETGLQVKNVGKHKAGRILDGKTHDGFPEVRP